MKITVVGMGYVGLSNAVMLATKHEVSILEIDQEKVLKLNNFQSPIQDSLIETYLKEKDLNLSATSDHNAAYEDTSIIIICTPTNFVNSKVGFDTSSIERVSSQIRELGFNGLIVIKSTVPIGFTESLEKNFPELNFAFFPEFLREGSALEDSLNPSRIICGSHKSEAKEFLNILIDSAQKKYIETLVVSSSEAEAIKLFSNTFLAMRVSFFNELDSYAIAKNLNSENIILGISMDERIGNYYNNPSFGYGGYCLPKDTKQLEADFADIPQELIKATVASNKKRKLFLTEQILKESSGSIGIYRLAMKAGSDNWRESALIDVIANINKDREVLIYEPLFEETFFMGIKVIKDFQRFVEASELILVNRIDEKITPWKNKIYTRDIFQNN